MTADILDEIDDVLADWADPGWPRAAMWARKDLQEVKTGA